MIVPRRNRANHIHFSIKTARRLTFEAIHCMTDNNVHSLCITIPTVALATIVPDHI